MEKEIIELLERMEKMPVFKDIEDRAHEIEHNLQNAVQETCKIYQLSGYLRGINEGIRIANSMNSNKIKVYDMITQENIL